MSIKICLATHDHNEFRISMRDRNLLELCPLYKAVAVDSGDETTGGTSFPGQILVPNLPPLEKRRFFF